jgi:PAS domain-containing protein
MSGHPSDFTGGIPEHYDQYLGPVLFADYASDIAQRTAMTSPARVLELAAGTGIATVFVDHQLRILRFTPTASQLIHLIASDVGRPVGHLVSNLVGYDNLVADVQEVLDTLTPKEAQVRTVAGSWFTMRIRPYRTLDNVIEGAVITFVDITETKRVQDALAEANDRIRQAITREGGEALAATAPGQDAANGRKERDTR